MPLVHHVAAGASYQSAIVAAARPWTPAERDSFAAQMRTIANGGDLPSESGVVFLDPRGGPPLYAHDPDLPLVPGSTIKLLVTAAIMDALGPDYRFLTKVVSLAPISGDTIAGDVFLVGSGDPELSTHDLREAAGRLRAQGVSRITGSVYADGSAFGADAVDGSWMAEDLKYGWAAPASAVSIDNGAIQFTVIPNAVGSPSTIQVDPPGAVDRINGAVLTAGYSDGTDLRIDPADAPATYDVSGQIPAGAPQKFWRSLRDPTPRAAIIFSTILRQAGIAVGGSWATAQAPPQAVTLWEHRSRPLGAIVKHMAFDSDNHIAEQLLRVLGKHAAGLGSPDNGLTAERTLLEHLGADSPNLVLRDGSGLSADNRVSANALAAALRYLVSGPQAQRMIEMLPRVAVEGTVRFRPLDGAARGRVYGKSGYIEGATGLAGYVITRTHGVVIYAMLSNAWTNSLDAVWSAQSRMLDLAARW